MKKIIAILLATLSFASVSKADITQQQFSTAQIWDVQWYISNNTLYASGFNYLYASVDASGQPSASRLTQTNYNDFNSNGRYISFVDASNVPAQYRVANTYGLAVFNSDGTVYRWIDYTGTFRAIGNGAIFYNGNGMWGTLFTTLQGYSAGQSGNWPVTTNNPSYSDLQAFVPANTQPLAAGQSAGQAQTPATPTPVGSPTTTYNRSGTTTIYGNWTPFVTVITDARTNSGKNGVITRTTDNYDQRTVTSRVVVTPVNHQLMSDGTTVDTNGTAYNDDTVQNPQQRLGTTSATSQSFPRMGYTDFTNLRKFNPFLIDVLSKKDGAWISPNASYYKTVGNMSSGGTSAGYQWTADNNVFGVAANWTAGKSNDIAFSKINNESYDANAYALIKDSDLWVKTAVGIGYGKFDGSTNLPVFALTNSAKFNQKTFYSDITIYTADTYWDIRPLAGVTVVNSRLGSIVETGSTLLSTIPESKASTTFNPYVGLRYDFDKNFGIETRITQSKDFKTVGSIRATANTEIFDDVFLNATVGVDKSSNLTGFSGTVGVKVNF